MIFTQRLIQDLALAHGVDAETIVRAAVTDFALGRSHMGREQALLAAKIDAAHGDENCHLPPSEATKIVTSPNPL